MHTIDQELILSFLDKSVLLVVWTIALVYSVISPTLIRSVISQAMTPVIFCFIGMRTLITTVIFVRNGTVKQVKMEIHFIHEMISV